MAKKDTKATEKIDNTITTSGEAESGSQSSRTRNYATIVYPESAPEDWISILEDTKVPALISPLHDRDINQKAEKEVKKAHYHVILMYSSVKTLLQAKQTISAFGGVGCEAVQSIRGYARYLCHLDNADKAQYDEGQIIALNGADYFGCKELVTDKYKAINQMMDYCAAQEIFDMCELIDYARQERLDWFRVLCDSSTILMREYLRSAQYRAASRRKKMWSEENNV